MAWNTAAVIPSIKFRCGYCVLAVASDRGFIANSNWPRLYICPHCDRPTYFDGQSLQVPGMVPGNKIEHVPESLQLLYFEARNCCGVSAFTASVLALRKLLMNIAVEQGAETGKKFIEYVDYLASAGFIPPHGRHWVDHIRKKGNEATHEIALMNKDDAEELITFTEMLLKFIYEFPARVPKTS